MNKKTLLLVGLLSFIIIICVAFCSCDKVKSAYDSVSSKVKSTYDDISDKIHDTFDGKNNDNSNSNSDNSGGNDNSNSNSGNSGGNDNSNNNGDVVHYTNIYNTTFSNDDYGILITLPANVDAEINSTANISQRSSLTYYIFISHSCTISVTITDKTDTSNVLNRTFDCVVLDNPVLTFSNGTLNWSEVQYASGYRLMKNGQVLFTCSSNNCDINGYLNSAGTTRFSIIPYALPSNKYYFANSDLASISITKLNAPVIELSGSYLIWNSITDAQRYDIYVDGNYYGSTQQTQYRVSGSNFFDKQVQVVASSNNSNIIESDKSNIICPDIA